MNPDVYPYECPLGFDLAKYFNNAMLHATENTMTVQLKNTF